jgi:hypothetical protein
VCILDRPCKLITRARCSTHSARPDKVGDQKASALAQAKHSQSILVDEDTYWDSVNYPKLMYASFNSIKVKVRSVSTHLHAYARA